MEPTDENIREVAEFRLRKQPELIDNVIERAQYYRDRTHSAAKTAAQAVEWAMHDFWEESPIGS